MRCHYCPAEATTRDHIVPKVFARQANVSHKIREKNIVMACYECNQKKSHFRSDCDCDRCLFAWAVLGPVAPKYPIKVIRMVARNVPLTDAS